MTIDHEKKLLTLIKIVPILIVVLFSLIIIYLVITTQIRQAKHEIEHVRDTLLSTKKEMVKDEVLRIVRHIDYERKISEEALKENIRNKVGKAHAIATNIYNQNKDKSKEIVIKMVKDALRPIRFNNGRGYIFMTSMNLINILLPITPQLEGTDISNVQDANGNYIVQDAARLVKQHGSTFHTYWWLKPQDKTKTYKKIGFYKYFEPFDCFIGAGEYFVDFEKELQEKLIKEIQEVRYNRNGYIFMNTYDGVTLTHINKTLIGKNRINMKDNDGRELTKEIIKISKGGGGFYEYMATLNPLTNLPAKKISYVTGINEWRWSIGAGAYLDDINGQIKLKEAYFKEQLQESILEIVGIFLFLGFVLALILHKFTQTSEAQFNKYKNEITEEAIKNEQQLILLQKQSKLASMGEMVGNIAHQWRQPLNAISLSVSKMILQIENTTSTKEMLLTSLINVEKNIIYLSRTIGVFRDFFQPEGLNEKFDVKREINIICAIVSDSFTHHFIKLSCSGRIGHSIKGDRKKLEQALINILSNAKDAIVANEQKNGKVAVHVEKIDHKIKITIQDNAGGIPEDIADKIFEPYFTTKFKSQGTGIGLYMSKLIIENNFNGKISFENKNGGAEFRILI